MMKARLIYDSLAFLLFLQYLTMNRNSLALIVIVGYLIVYCLYFQAHVNVRRTWFIGGVFKNEDYVAFERTLKGSNDIIEFFVPPAQEKVFLFLIDCLRQNGYVYSLQRLPNRLMLQQEDL